MQDATAEYGPIHPAGTIEKYLPADKHLGPVSGAAKDHERQPLDEDNATRQDPLSVLQNLDDFERQARKILSPKALIYYSSAADSLTSHHKNVEDWSRITLRPRILRCVFSALLGCSL